MPPDANTALEETKLGGSEKSLTAEKLRAKA